jgi:glycosyltransferase involved in cell wall biosynthesis
VVESPLQKKVKEKNIEFMWFLTPIYESVDIPYIATMFDIQHRLQPWFPEVGTNVMWNYRESYYSTHLRRATYIITPNEIGMKELALFYQITPDRFRLLQHPVPSVEAPMSSEDIQKVLEKHKIPPLYLIYPAQFWPHKNHVNLLLALQILRDQYQIDIDLVLVGSEKGNMQFVQDVAKRLSLSQHVHFLGFVPRYELIALYQGAFALTYVSFFGPENLPPLEAFACECPVIASDVPGSKEQFDDAALIVKGHQPEDIAQAVKKLINDPALRKSFIEKGKKRAMRYTSNDYVQDIFRMLNEFEPVRRNWQ